MDKAVRDVFEKKNFPSEGLTTREIFEEGDFKFSKSNDPLQMLRMHMSSGKRSGRYLKTDKGYAFNTDFDNENKPIEKRKNTTPSSKPEKKVKSTNSLEFFKNFDLPSNIISLDYGSTRSVMVKATSGSLDTPKDFDSFITYKVSSKGDVTCSPMKLSVSGFTAKDIQNTPEHLKSKLGIGQRLNSDLKTKLKDENNQDIDVDNVKLIILAIKTYLTSYGFDVKKYEEFIFSCPNNYSYNELLQFKDIVKEAVNGLGWKGKIFCYYESEAALFKNFADLQKNDKLFPGNYLIVDQGDSTTNMSIANVTKDSIILNHHGLTFGASEYTQILKIMFVESFKKHKKSTPNAITLFKLKLRDLKDWKVDLLNEDSKEYKLIYNEVDIMINVQEFDDKCLPWYKKLNDELERFIQKSNCNEFQKIIFTGGGMLNKKQSKYLKSSVLKGIDESYFMEDEAKNHVAKGLHFRHLFESYGNDIIIEKNPYGIYTILVDEKTKERNLFCVLKKEHEKYTNPQSLQILSHPSLVAFPLVQVDVDEILKINPNADLDEIKYSQEYDDVNIVKIGEMIFEKPKEITGKYYNVKFGAIWKSKEISFMVSVQENGKTYKTSNKFDQLTSLKQTIKELQTNDNILK